jgi:ribosomal-protein-alanine N-acetyltransferase
VEDKTTGAFVGQCGLRAVDEDYGPEIDFAYRYLRTSWNKGYATEAVIAVLGHGLGSIGLDRIVAAAMAGNVGSWRVMEKSGMRYEGLATYSGMADRKKYAAERQ